MKVAVFFGGVGPEREVSLASGKAVLEALAHTDWEAIPVEVTAEGFFCIDGELRHPTWGLAELLRKGIDAAFPALHGPLGEDGVLQGFFQAAQVPYVGSGVESSALAMNKHAARLVLSHASLPVPKGGLLQENAVAGQLAFPVVVKPCRLGSSVGVQIARNKEELAASAASVRNLGQVPLVEEYIEGTEYSCPVWEVQGEIRPLPVVQIRPLPEHGFFSYEAKYSPGQAEEVVRTGGDPLLRTLQDFAVRAHAALGCRSFSRTDFVVDPQRGPFVLELNTLPGLTGASLLPKALQAAGYRLVDLVRHSVQEAVERFGHRRRDSITV